MCFNFSLIWQFKIWERSFQFFLLSFPHSFYIVVFCFFLIFYSSFLFVSHSHLPFRAHTQLLFQRGGVYDAVVSTEPRLSFVTLILSFLWDPFPPSFSAVVHVHWHFPPHLITHVGSFAGWLGLFEQGAMSPSKAWIWCPFPDICVQEMLIRLTFAI
jgi:hypothetical protein